MDGCKDISDQSDGRPLHQNPGHGPEPIVQEAESTDAGAGPHLEKLFGTKQTCTSLPAQEIPSSSPIIKDEEQAHDILGSCYTEGGWHALLTSHRV